MDRREFLRSSSLIVTGAIAANQLDIMEKISRMLWKRKYFPGHTFDYGRINVANYPRGIYNAIAGEQLKTGDLVVMTRISRDKVVMMKARGRTVDAVVMGETSIKRVGSGRGPYDFKQFDAVKYYPEMKLNKEP